MKGLVKLFHWWYDNMQQGQLGGGGRIQFIVAFFYNFPLFSEIFIRIDEYAN